MMEKAQSRAKVKRQKIQAIPYSYTNFGVIELLLLFSQENQLTSVRIFVLNPKQVDKQTTATQLY
jgi:hypothetical protein